MKYIGQVMVEWLHEEYPVVLEALPEPICDSRANFDDINIYLADLADKKRMVKG
jgi:hypothetical protein